MIVSRLKQLAGNDAIRCEVLKQRADRKLSRSRRITCPVCLDVGYDDRAKEDICDECLADLWGAKNIIAGEYKAGKKGGLVPVCLTNTFHWLDYPGLETGDRYAMPEDAPFYRADGDTSNDILRKLFVEAFASLAEALPVDPESRRDADPLIACQGTFGDTMMYARLPGPLVRAFRDLWQFVKWHSQEAHLQGFSEGHALLQRMNAGEETHAGFLEEIARQTINAQEAMKKAARKREPKKKERA